MVTIMFPLETDVPASMVLATLTLPIGLATRARDSVSDAEVLTPSSIERMFE